MAQNNHDDTSMSISNETVFNLLVELKESVGKLGSHIESMDGKMDDLGEEINKASQAAQDAKDIAQEAQVEADKVKQSLQSKSQWILYAWIPILSSIIPTLLNHINIR